MNSWITLLSYIERGRNPNYRTLMNNTVAIRHDDDSISVRLHNTDVLTYHENGLVTYGTGGWYTVTTKDRFNRYGPNGFSVYSDRKVWYIYYAGERSRFFDGITVDPETLEIVNPEDGPDFEDLDTKNAETRKRIRKYVNLYTDDRIRELIQHAREQGMAGDCLMCQFGPDANLGSDHFESHFDEGYTMASTMFNAYKIKGYGDPALVLMMDAERTPKDVRTNLRKYLEGQLLENVSYTR